MPRSARRPGRVLGLVLLWIVTGLLLLGGICFFALYALVGSQQAFLGFRLALVEQSTCDVPLTDTLVLTRRPDSYAAGQTVVFYRQDGSSVQIDCATLQESEDGLQIENQSGASALFSEEAALGTVVRCFPTLGRFVAFVGGSEQNTLFYWVGIALGAILLAAAVLLIVSAHRAPREKEAAPPERSPQAAYQPQPEQKPVALFSSEPEKAKESSPAPSSPPKTEPTEEELRALPWRKYAVREDVELKKQEF